MDQATFQTGSLTTIGFKSPIAIGIPGHSDRFSVVLIDAAVVDISRSHVPIQEFAYPAPSGATKTDSDIVPDNNVQTAGQQCPKVAT